MADPITAAVVAFSKFAASTAAAVGASGATSAFVGNFVLGAIGQGAGLAAALGGFAASSAVSFAASALSKPKVLNPGAPQQFKTDSNAPRPFVLGRTAVGGVKVFGTTSGRGNKHLTFIAALAAAGPVHAIESLSLNGNNVTWNNSTGATTSVYNSQRLWHKTALGTVPGTALTQPTAPATDSPVPEWTSAHKLSGIAHAWLDLEYDTKIWTQGIPAPLWVVQGCKAYDPRLDSTYPGGSGAHRAANRATWTFTENPYLIGLLWCLGLQENGKRVGGIGAPLALIDVAAFVAGANVADANSWKAGGLVTAADNKYAVLTAILAAGGGEPVPRGATISCRVRAAQTSTVTLDETDLAGSVSWALPTARRDRKNTIIPRYRSEANKWQFVAADPIASATYITEDGEPRVREIDYAMVQNRIQAAQLGTLDLVDAREPWLFQAAFKPVGLRAEVGRVITFNAPSLGVSAQKCLVVAREVTVEGSVSLTLKSETDSKYAFAMGQTQTEPTFPTAPRGDPGDVPAPLSGAWAAAAASLVSGAESLPIIRVTGATDYAFAGTVLVEFVPTSLVNADPTLTPWRSFGEFPIGTTNVELSGLTALTAYTVAVSYRSTRGVVGARLVLSSVTTGAAVPAGVGDLVRRTNPGPNLFPDPSGQVGGAGDWFQADGIVVGDFAAAGGKFWYRAWPSGRGSGTTFHIYRWPASNGYFTGALTGYVSGGFTGDYYIRAVNAGGTEVATGPTVALNTAGVLTRSDTGSTVLAPSGTTHLDLVIRVFGSAAGYADLVVRDIKVEAGQLPTIYTSDRVQAKLSGTIADNAAIAATATGVVASRTSTLETQVQTPTTGLLARATSLESRTAVVEANKAEASSVTSLQAQIKLAANLIINSTFNLGAAGWSNMPGTAGNWGADPSNAEGGWANVFGSVTANSAQAFGTATIPNVSAGQAFSFQGEVALSGRTAGSTRAYIGFLDSGGTVISFVVLTQSANTTGWLQLKAENQTAPPGTTQARIFIDNLSLSLSGGYALWKRLKFERGPVCTLWTDEATARDISASVQIVASAQATTAGKVAATYGVRVNAGGLVTGFGLSSDGTESLFKIQANRFEIGDGTSLKAPFTFAGGELSLANKLSIGALTDIALDPVTKTITITKGSYKQVIGAGFGASSDLLDWWGPAATAIGSMTKTNGIQARATDGKPYLGTNELLNGGNAVKVTRDASLLTGARSGTGSVTTSDAVTATATGGTGSYSSYSWVFVRGDPTVVPTAPTAATTFFTASITALGQTRAAEYRCDVVDSAGESGFCAPVEAILTETA